MSPRRKQKRKQAAAAALPEKKISRTDIESKLRELQGEVDENLESARSIGIAAGVICYFASTSVKKMFGYDDSLDAFGVHCIGGIVGAIGTGILVNPALGGTGVMDYVAGKVGDYDFAAQMTSQVWGVCTTLVWSGIGSAILYKVVDVIVGLRATVEVEREGLDLTDHTERAYNM